MKSARIIRTNEPLLVEEVAVPRPKYDQVLVRVQSAGLCHSDLHLWEGGYVGPALDQANQALGDLKSGKIIGRAVLNPEN